MGQGREGRANLRLAVEARFLEEARERHLANPRFEVLSPSHPQSGLGPTKLHSDLTTLHFRESFPARPKQVHSQPRPQLPCGPPRPPGPLPPRPPGPHCA